MGQIEKIGLSSERRAHPVSLRVDLNKRGRTRFGSNNPTLGGVVARIVLAVGVGLAGGAAFPAAHIITGYGEYFQKMHNPDMTSSEDFNLRVRHVFLGEKR